MGLLTKKITDYLFIDIETASQYKTFDELVEKNPRLTDLWLKKSAKFREDKNYQTDLFYRPDSERTDLSNTIYFDKSSIYPEFGKIICITIGYFNSLEDGTLEKKIKVFSNENELELLKEFNKSITHKIFENKILFGHNISNFDIPYIAKKYVFNGYNIPKKLNTVGLKPWQTDDIMFDTMNIFKLGSFEILSFDLLTSCLGVDSPKTIIDGSKVNEYYWYKKDGLNIIKDYNYSDVNALMDCAIVMSELKDM
jgi:DNA polymerase elongation subunit (family B)